MNIKQYRRFAFFVLAACGFTEQTNAEPGTDQVKNVVITVNDNMKFSVQKIDVSAGQVVHVQLENQGTFPKEAMGHNWVLLKSGIDAATYASAAASKKAEDYQPAAMSNETLATIGLLGAHETGETTFTAPIVPGKYFFLCSFPGHIQSGMKGVLTVN